VAAAPRGCTAVESQDDAARLAEKPPTKPGTAAHRELFCRTFIDTHDPYEPERLPWPLLDELHLERLRAFPLWSYGRSIEQRAGRMETRHGRLMSDVLERYGIDAPH
jgi:hypothetical protein